MKLNPVLLKSSKEGLYLLAVLTFGLLTYSIVLIIGIPIKLNLLLSALDPFFLCLFILAFLYFAYRPFGWLGKLTSFSGTLILFAVQLSAVWRNGLGSSQTFLLAGLLPMNDAKEYYEGALNLLEGGYLSGAAAYRPLAQGILATLLAVTQQNLQITIGILVLISAISCFFLAREIQQSHGIMPGVLVLTIIFLFYRIRIGTVMTENVGLALGAIALAILWRGTIQGKINLCLLGILLITLALNARAGTFFILPALVLWGTWSFRGTSRFSAHFLIGGFSAVLLGFIINSIVLKTIASPDTVVNSNFSYTLYGLIVGENWTAFFRDHPEVMGTTMHITSPEQSQKIYQLAFAAFRTHPWAWVGGFLRSWRIFLFDNFIFSFVRNINLNIILQLLSLVAIFNCYRQRKTPIGSLMIATLMGILLSIPFVPPWDGGTRVYAATIPFFSLFPALGLYFIAEKYKINQLLRVPNQKNISPVLWILGIIFAFFTIAGPMTINFLKQTPKLAEISCPEGSEVIYFRNNPGSSINIVSDEEIKRTNVPNVRISDFQSSLSQLYSLYDQLTGELKQLTPNTTLLQRINLKNGQSIKLIVNSQLLQKDTGILAACSKTKTVILGDMPGYVKFQENIYFGDSIKLSSH